VQVLVDELSIVEVHDLIDAIGELVAAVLDVHRGLPLRQVAAIDIGDAAHGTMPRSADGMRQA